MIQEFVSTVSMRYIKTLSSLFVVRQKTCIYLRVFLYHVVETRAFFCYSFGFVEINIYIHEHARLNMLSLFVKAVCKQLSQNIQNRK